MTGFFLLAALIGVAWLAAWAVLPEVREYWSPFDVIEGDGHGAPRGAAVSTQRDPARRLGRRGATPDRPPGGEGNSVPADGGRQLGRARHAPWMSGRRGGVRSSVRRAPER
jgi:hypothetical protein